MDKIQQLLENWSGLQANIGDPHIEIWKSYEILPKKDDTITDTYVELCWNITLKVEINGELVPCKTSYFRIRSPYYLVSQAISAINTSDLISEIIAHLNQ